MYTAYFPVGTQIQKGPGWDLISSLPGHNHAHLQVCQRCNFVVKKQGRIINQNHSESAKLFLHLTPAGLCRL